MKAHMSYSVVVLCTGESTGRTFSKTFDVLAGLNAFSRVYVSLFSAFSDAKGTLMLPEDLPLGTVVGRLELQELPLGCNVSVAYSVTDVRGVFGLDNLNNVVVIDTAGLNFESPGGPAFVFLVGSNMTVDDGQQLSVWGLFNAASEDVNEAGVIALASKTVMEGSPAGTVIGQVDYIDLDQLSAFKCQLGESTAQAGWFQIDGNHTLLLAKNGIDFETQPVLSVDVICLDESSLPVLTVRGSFSITVIDVNEAPTGVSFGVSNDDYFLTLADILPIDLDRNGSVPRVELVHSNNGRFILERFRLRFDNPYVRVTPEDVFPILLRLTDQGKASAEFPVAISFCRALNESTTVAFDAGKLTICQPSSWEFWYHRDEDVEIERSRRASATRAGNHSTISSILFSEVSILEDTDVNTVVCKVTVKAQGSASGLGMKHGHEYRVGIRAHDIISVGPIRSRWTTSPWPNANEFNNNHALVLEKHIRIDETPPEFLDLYIPRKMEGHDERVPVLFGDDERLDDVNLPASELDVGEGYTFFYSSQIDLMRLGFGVNDEESGLKKYRFRITEHGLRQIGSTGPYNRTGANQVMMLIEGEWNPDNKAVQNTSSSQYLHLCKNVSKHNDILVHHANCTNGNPLLCQRSTPEVACFCTTYGSHDSCFQRFYIQALNVPILPINYNTTSESFTTGQSTWRGGRTTYWHMFEFEVQYNITNYALLTNSRKL
jgi:hypothetical protein